MVSNILETCLWEVIGICASLIFHTRESNQVCLNVRFLIKYKETILVFLLNALTVRWLWLPVHQTYLQRQQRLY